MTKQVKMTGNYGNILTRFQLLWANAARALACIGGRLLKRGCICWPYREIKWEKALPTRALTSEVSSGDTTTWAKRLTNSGTRERICLHQKWKNKTSKNHFLESKNLNNRSANFTLRLGNKTKYLGIWWQNKSRYATIYCHGLLMIFF